ncbi:zinc-binding dehydrogenase [Rathayibacter sp. VKM Ac-2803]|uniref:zinc-binding alcohol dehydrogenase family protein n=1 Tax=unclassified Rathayibacter TaxID=2609250 RepID=UPI001359C39A|nr:MULTISPECIES: zinc-binding alcohol dehydrogenase family protein [unclassified Rathayibacter]MWV51252.1 zinc-binding dehydrogenase [Rathayibacter sp. VKM Ac-2803]MWV57737.1 zinc-binding dehydrogenase [Rathayibacter sp. VKM Ac-2754]
MAAPEALWLRSRFGSLEVGEAPVATPGSGEVVVRARAVAVNPVDAVNGVARGFVYPWLSYPAVLGTDVAGDVVAVGPGVTVLAVGDRVTGFAVGAERSRNSPAEGAFQTHVTLLATLCARIPDALSFADASVLPLALTTAAAGLFETDQLALELPSAEAAERGTTVLVLGAATSVGMNAVQLARSAGHRVVATASRSNAELLRELGAEAVVDYHDSDAVAQLVRVLDGHELVGTLAVASGSLPIALAVDSARGAGGMRRIASAHPTPVTTVRAALARRRGVRVTAIWGGSPKDTPVGPGVWNAYLPGALADGRHRAAPQARVVGHGLAAIPEALVRLRAGARAEKFVVTL